MHIRLLTWGAKLWGWCCRFWAPRVSVPLGPCRLRRWSNPRTRCNSGIFKFSQSLSDQSAKYCHWLTCLPLFKFSFVLAGAMSCIGRFVIQKIDLVVSFHKWGSHNTRSKYPVLFRAGRLPFPGYYDASQHLNVFTQACSTFLLFSIISSAISLCMDQQRVLEVVCTYAVRTWHSYMWKGFHVLKIFIYLKYVYKAFHCGTELSERTFQ